MSTDSTPATTAHDPAATGAEGNAAALADRYFALWNETDSDRRATAITTTWASDGAFVDPSFEATGHQELNALIAGAQQLFPGHRFTRTGEIDHHHNHLRWTWELAAEGRAPIAGGTDIVTLTPAGQIQQVIGFLDFAPAH
ncbi:conserved hypothetical protein [Kribbella flavida DSM 17836]|uniref:Uncharacterized protein n=1 Tax=Kribbella flavida (strain DSM 17836 / JCM 10339 / NBRC 14399) TaxID=479435 RepID=D2PUE9_KRIFD|nr:nuclear transport factor 2 family protein [Kribbella flavida]ADB29467.1 conserved hypothetical protein [Kribbella flavida DSM 17836]